MVSILDVASHSLVGEQVNEWFANLCDSPRFSNQFGFFCIECIST